MRFLKAITILLLLSLPAFASAKVEKKPNSRTKFYNFDDLLINGKVKKPQVLYTDARQKIKFGKLLKLRKDFLPKLESTKKDKTLR